MRECVVDTARVIEGCTIRAPKTFRELKHLRRYDVSKEVDGWRSSTATTNSIRRMTRRDVAYFDELLYDHLRGHSEELREHLLGFCRGDPERKRLSRALDLREVLQLAKSLEAVVEGLRDGSKTLGKARREVRELVEKHEGT